MKNVSEDISVAAALRVCLSGCVGASVMQGAVWRPTYCGHRHHPFIAPLPGPLCQQGPVLVIVWASQGHTHPRELLLARWKQRILVAPMRPVPVAHKRRGRRPVFVLVREGTAVGLIGHVLDQRHLRVPAHTEG